MEVPSQMLNLPIWFCWTYENGTKVPYQTNLNQKARANDPSTWSRLQEALDTKRPLAFGFDRSYGIVGIDLDGCIVNDEIQPWALEIIEKFSCTYIEYSPSGSGLKIIAKAIIPPEVLDTKKRVNLPELTIEGGKKAAIEFFVNRCYFTFTGEHFPGSEMDLSDCQESFEELLKQYSKPEPKQALRPYYKPSIYGRS
jgi:primase-polymerase (primpol)-like protein